MDSRVIAHVDLDAFFAAVEQRDRPELRGRPVVVGANPQNGRGRGVVSTCSYEARRFGIRSAMPISRAYQLCPHAVFLPVDGAKYRQASQKVFGVFEEFTPEIEPVSIDEAFLDLSGSHHLFGGVEAACRRLKRRIVDSVGLTASVGVSSVKFAAKIASDYCKPDGLLIIPPDGVMDFLRPLPVARLWGAGPKMCAALNSRGIMTIGQLADTALRRLVELYGEHGAHLHALANGIDPRGVVCDDTVKSVSHEHTFNVDCTDTAAVERVIMDISEKLSRRLRKQDLQGKTLTAKIRLKDFKTFSRSVTLGERTNHADRIFSEGVKLFRAFYQRGMAIRLIGLRVTHFEDAYVQNSLFADPGAMKNERVHSVIDTIKNRFGEDAIHRAL